MSSSEQVPEDTATDRPPPDPAKLLASWMQWEKGQETPGRVMADLKKGGLREVLEQLAAEQGTS